MYPEHLVSPMREELTSIGFNELKTAEAVDAFMKEHKGTSLVMINSVCGCAAGAARPGVAMSLDATVFAGADIEAVAKMREYTLPYPPSSPAIALFKDGELVHMIERHHIEGRPAKMIAEHLEQVYEEFC
jgi:putative YphP/YqiW family bacilliredoxin